MPIRTLICIRCGASFVPQEKGQPMFCNKCKEVGDKMGSIKDEAQAYKPPQPTKNVADLQKVAIDAEIIPDSFDCIDEKTGKPKTVNQKVIVVEGEKYRVPDSVLADLKAQVEAKPDLKWFRVTKAGSGLQTRYTVIPLD